jgi:hypothetical protein
MPKNTFLSNESLPPRSYAVRHLGTPYKTRGKITVIVLRSPIIWLIVLPKRGLVTTRLTGLAVTGLHGVFDIDVPVRDNRLILVGVNGLGKSTFVNILYLLLSRQWSRLIEIDFESVSLHTTGETITLSHEAIQNSLRSTDGIRSIPPSAIRVLQRLQEEGTLEAFLEATPSELPRFQEVIQFAPHVLD